MKEWSKEHCSVQPEALELIAPGIYMERKNITKVEHAADETAGTPAFVEWTCDSREITVSEYEMLQSVAGISNDKAIDAYTSQLLDEGVL